MVSVKEMMTPEYFAELLKRKTVGGKARIDLGSGRQAAEVPDYIHIDKWDGDDIDIVQDLDGGLPRVLIIPWEKSEMAFAPSTVDEIRAHHLCEHIRNLYQLMDDCWDALKPNGILHICVPNGHHLKAAYSDPTHVRTFVPETFNYFCHDALSAFPYTTKEWRIHGGYPKVNGTSPDDLWEIECIMSPVK